MWDLVHRGKRTARAFNQGWPLCGLIVAATLVTQTCATAHAGPSRSYQLGYKELMNTSRGVLAIASGDGYHESLAQVVGSPQMAAKMCEGLLEGIFESAAVGARPQPPTDFSSADFLQGCNDAAKEILASGR